MATVSNTIHGPDGEPLVGVKVELELVYNKRVQAIPLDSANDVTVLGVYATTTNSEGRWSVDDVVPNDDITPAQSVYRVIERIRPGRKAFIYYIDVADAATPVYWVGDILTDKPAWSP